jgi:hypothetical protein
MFLFVVLIGNTGAQDLESSVVTGNTYSCYFLTPLDVVSTNITFAEKGGLTFSGFEGNGFYINLTNFFVGAYWALNANVGNISGDVIFLINGMEFDPFIVGTGVVIIEYSEPYILVFFGSRIIE